MKKMILKSAFLATCLLFLGIATAQVIEESNSIPELSAPPPPVPVPIVTGERATGNIMEIVDFPDVAAQFPGGTKALHVFIQKNVQYPVDAVENNIQGRVYVTFVVEPDGSLSGIEVMRGGVYPSINNEAERLIRVMPNWTPGETDGNKVRSRCRLPITFTLGNTEEKEVPEKKH